MSANDVYTVEILKNNKDYYNKKIFIFNKKIPVEFLDIMKKYVSYAEIQISIAEKFYIYQYKREIKNLDDKILHNDLNYEYVEKKRETIRKIMNSGIKRSVDIWIEYLDNSLSNLS